MHFVLHKLCLTVVSGPCLFSNALLCPDLWATVYAAAAAVIVYLFVVVFFFQQATRKNLRLPHTGAQKNWGRGR